VSVIVIVPAGAFASVLTTSPLRSSRTVFPAAMPEIWKTGAFDGLTIALLKLVTASLLDEPESLVESKLRLNGVMDAVARMVTVEPAQAGATLTATSVTTTV